jgi:hypothetical protein
MFVRPRCEWTPHVSLSLPRAVTHTELALLSGTLPLSPLTGQWYTIRLTVAGASAAGYFNGQQVFSGLRVDAAAPAAGFAGIATGDWGMHVLFDRFAVTAS